MAAPFIHVLYGPANPYSERRLPTILTIRILSRASPPLHGCNAKSDNHHARKALKVRKEATSSQLLPGAIAEFNRYEYSRPMRLVDSEQPIKMYSHIAPYLGGPMEIKNTNGAGDGALSAVLHDMLANTYHKDIVPNSDKHSTNFLAYSSLSQLCKYANRVSYEVLAQHSPRLLKGLPEREDSLDESYWSS